VQIRASAHDSGSRAGWLFGAVTVVPAMLAAAWLLPGLPLLLANRLSVLPMVFMFAPLAFGLCFFAVRQLPTTWPTWRAAPATPPAPRDNSTPWWAIAATIAVAVAFTVWQIAEHTEQIIFLRDPSTYLEVGYWIAHHGSLPIPDSAVAFGAAGHGASNSLSFASVNYYPRGSGIVPQFMTGMPLVIAAAIWLGGIPAALVLTPVIGGAAILSFGGLAGRLIGTRWAPAAAAVLALSLPEQYTSRSTFSEPLAQVLLFGGLCLLVDSLTIRRSQSLSQNQNGQRQPPQPAPWPHQDRVLAALAGLALGLTILVRIDGLSDILPVVPFLGVMLAGRRRQATPLIAGLVIGVGYGLADGFFRSRPYLDLEAQFLRPLAAITGLIVVLTAVVVAVTTSPKARGWLKRIARKKPIRALPTAAAVITALIFVGFAIRPLVQTVRGETIPASIAYVAELQKLAGLPVDGKDQYYQDSLYWVCWYIGVPAVLLGAFGLAVLARRCVKALIDWNDDTGVARIWALPLMMAIWVIVTVLYDPAVAPDQPWAGRRLVPFVLPGLILAATWAATWLKDVAARLGRGKTTAAAVASCAMASLVIPTALTTLDLGFTSRGLSAHGMAFRRIGAGELTAVNKLCRSIGPDASVVILDSLTADRFAQVIRGVCGMPTATLDPATATAGGQQAAVRNAVQGIESVGRRPVLLAENQAELTQYGPPPTEVVNLLTTQEAHNLTSPPTRTWLIHYTVWMSLPANTSPGSGTD
jgi:hypothetical protein